MVGVSTDVSRWIRAAAGAGAFAVFSSAYSSPYASNWISYNSGVGASEGFTDPAASLGSPTRYSGFSYGYPGAVSPFSPAADPADLTSIGRGGSLVLAFDHDVYNRPTNAFGFDFIVFGNWFNVYKANPGGFDLPGTATGQYFGKNGGTIEVSQDGENWRLVTTRVTDGYATLGYLDLTSDFQSTPGSVLSDFTKPVDPSFNPAGKTLSEIIAGYNGSGGGTGVDFASTGLDFIRYVRISNPDGNIGAINIDGIAEVPAPVTASLLVIASLIAPRRRRA